jgi:hypothetical protein
MQLLGRGAEPRTNCLIMAVCAIAGATGLLLFGRSVWNEGNFHAAASGVTVRSEVQTIFAPKALIAFASEHIDVSTHDELVRKVREAKLRVWFAVAFKYHQADGSFAKVPIACRLGERPESFRNEKAILLRLAGRPPWSSFWECAEADVVVFDDALLEMEPLDGLRSLLGR